MSIRNDDPAAVEERILDAAAELLAVAPGPPAIAELARRAGVSRPTVYRRFADGDAVVKALWNREIGRLLAARPRPATTRQALVTRIVDIADRISSDATLASTYRADPLLMARYITDRLGTGQQVLLDIVREQIRANQRSGTIRAGKAGELAAMTLLIAQSAVQSRRMIADHLPPQAWRRELARALNGYLAPQVRA